MPQSAAKLAEMQEMEIVAARHYVQDELSTAQIAERLHKSQWTVTTALKRVGIPVDKNRRTWREGFA